MDSFTEQYARSQRAVLNHQIGRATAFGPHVAAAKHERTRRWVRAVRWLQSTIAPLRERTETADAPTVRRPSSRAVRTTTRPQAPEHETEALDTLSTEGETAEESAEPVGGILNDATLALMTSVDVVGLDAQRARVGKEQS